jgi:hypothetical protein
MKEKVVIAAAILVTVLGAAFVVRFAYGFMLHGKLDKAGQTLWQMHSMCLSAESGDRAVLEAQCRAEGTWCSFEDPWGTPLRISYDPQSGQCTVASAGSNKRWGDVCARGSHNIAGDAIIQGDKWLQNCW